VHLSCKNNAETTTPTPKQPIHLSQQAPAKKHEKKKHEKKKKKKKNGIFSNLFTFALSDSAAALASAALRTTPNFCTVTPNPFRRSLLCHS
jgi:hypothetical protein